ncbi:MAG TPA: ATPase domain-containing protein [Chthoniobacterales bacterium]|jgi:circadian clock protein KaiC|nr:ATPase domain-containing protein [Chthoniobacterales bacterium]
MNRTEGSKVKTGIAGLDDILRGGFPPRRLYLVQGAPGSGKTTLALQFLLAGARAGERVLYISLSETRDEIDEVARSHGWSLDGLEIVELAAIDEQLSADSQNTLFHTAEVELSETTKLLLDAFDRVQPTRLAFDSLSELRLLSQSSLRYRRQILAFKQYLAGRNCTTLLLDDVGTAESDSQVESLAHGVISLDQTCPAYGAERRRFVVKKIRGTTYRGGFHDFIIETGGLVLYPRLVAAEHHRSFPNENVSSGVNGIDALLGGGLTRGTSSLFIGPPGCGKSTLALHFALAAAARGERSQIYSFDESLGTMRARAEGLKMGLTKLVDEKLIATTQIDPAELSPGQLNSLVRHAVEGENTRLILIDSLNGYLQSMSDDRALSLQLHELLTYLNQQGVVTILILAQHGLIGYMQTPVDVTYLADTVVTLRYFEAQGAVHKALAVVKKRTGSHEGTIRELRIADTGLTVGAPLENFRGVLSGTPELLKVKPPPAARRRGDEKRR